MEEINKMKIKTGEPRKVELIDELKEMWEKIPDNPRTVISKELDISHQIGAQFRELATYEEGLKTEWLRRKLDEMGHCFGSLEDFYAFCKVRVRLVREVTSINSQHFYLDGNREKHIGTWVTVHENIMGPNEYRINVKSYGS
jgi:hypothetical protein